MPETKSTLNRFDFWSLVHFFGCLAISLIAGIILSAIFDSYFKPLRVAFYIAWIAGGFWEILDQLYSDFRSNFDLETMYILDRIFDPRGASWLDFVVDTAGAFAGIGIIKLIEWSVR